MVWDPYLEKFALVVPFEIVGEDVGVHEGAPALAQNVHGLLQELDFDPGHVVLLHLLHLVLQKEEKPSRSCSYQGRLELSYHFNYFDHAVKLILEFERLKVVHVAVAVEEIALQGRPRFVLQGEHSDRIKKLFS